MPDTTLRQAREQAGLTLRELARQTGIAYTELSRLQNGLRRLWPGYVARIQTVLPLWQPEAKSTLGPPLKMHYAPLGTHQPCAPGCRLTSQPRPLQCTATLRSVTCKRCLAYVRRHGAMQSHKEA